MKINFKAEKYFIYYSGNFLVCQYIKCTGRINTNFISTQDISTKVWLEGTNQKLIKGSETFKENGDKSNDE